jgi:hypothetical protein
MRRAQRNGGRCLDDNAAEDNAAKTVLPKDDAAEDGKGA